MLKTTNEDNLSQRIRYRFSEHETIDQLENVLVIDLETYNDQEFAEAYAAALFDVNRLRDWWDRYLIPEEIEIERKYRKHVIAFDNHVGIVL